VTSAPARLSAGLYLVSTPLGSARDITLRALDILGAADVLAAEDTRTLRKLMDIHGIPLQGRPLVACHDHSGPREVAGLVASVAAGKSVAYASEAGTPLVSDPGFALVRAMYVEGLPVTAAPGPAAAVAALTLSGLPADRFLFCGFPPARQAERRTWLAEALAVPATAIFYESPKRIKDLFADLVHIVGSDRPAAICRELTKRFEEVRRGTVGDLAAALDEAETRGEFVVLVAGGPSAEGEMDVEAALEVAMRTMSVKDAAQAVAAASGRPRRDVYQAALRLAEQRK
jgi:16S rRNA (cytidine1402-2'-O)-methyltransferase